MAKWARVENGVVRETTDVDPKGRFHPDLVWVSCPDTVEDGYLHDGKGFTAPPPPEPTTAVDLAPGRSLEGLTPEEIAELEALAEIVNTNPEALKTATEQANG